MKVKQYSLGLLVIIFMGFIFQSILIFPSNMKPFETNPLLSTEANFYAVSESENPTHWILQGADITPFEDFHDDISGNNWRLKDVSDVWFDKNIIQSANYQLDNTTTSSIWGYSGINFYVGGLFSYPEDICWDGTHYQVLRSNAKVYEYTSTGEWTWNSFNVGDQDVAPRGITWDGSYFWITGDASNRIYKYTSAGDYTEVSFYVGNRDIAPKGICWDGSNLWVVGSMNNEVFKYTSAGVYTGVSFYVGDQDTYPKGICWDGSNFWVVGSVNNEVYKYTSAGVYTGVSFYVGDQENQPSGITWYGTYLHIVGETHERAYKYQLLITISKKYQGSGYIYMQTNITELISLLSTDYGIHYTLESGDYFEVDFQTNSDSKIELLVYKDGNLQQTLTLSPNGNTNFNRHTTQIIVSGSLEFDQLKIRSTFEEIDYVKVWDIKTFKYIITGDYADFIVGSKRTHIVNLTSDIYNLRISDPYDCDTVVNENITIGITDYYYVYEPTDWIESRLTLFNIGKDVRLEFTDYHISINRSLYGVWDTIDLLENIFSVDIETNISINVSDQFGTSVYSDIRTSSSYIELELDVYRLQIKSLMELQTTVIINYTYSYPLLPDDSLYFMLSEKWYQIEYTNDDGDGRSILFFLDSNQAYVLNRSQICFLSYTDQSGNHLYFEDYKTYINGVLLYENIFYEDVGDIVSINITDRYDIPVYYQLYTVVSKNNYIPIVLDVYELKLMNMQDEFNNINITRSPYPIPNDTGDIIETGNFPATYNFKDEADGAIPSGWSTTGTDITNTVQVISSFDGHNKVVEIHRTDSQIFFYWDEATPRADQTIEFYMGVNNIGAKSALIYIYEGATVLISLRLYEADIEEYDGGAWNSVADDVISINTLHHFRLIFDDSNNQYDLYLDGSLIGNNIAYRHNSTTGIDNISFIANTDDMIIYVDAIGYSWDTEYNIGDNLNDYYYLGSESFEGYNITNDAEVELENNGWIVSVGADCSIGISGEYNLHKKFLNITRDGSNPEIEQSFGADKTSGTVEFYIKSNDVTQLSWFRLYDGGTSAIQISFKDEKIQYYIGGYNEICDASDNTWYHIRIDFECGSGGYEGLSADTFYIYVDGVRYGAYSFNNAVDNVDKIYFTCNSGATYSFYVDAIGYSWTSGYYIGDNYNYYDVDSEYSWTSNIAPDEVMSFRLLKGFYNIWMVNTEETKAFSFRLFDDRYFILNRSQMCFLSYTNQRGEYLEFNRFKTYLNGSLLYENIFYENIGIDVNITITDHYGYEVSETIYMVLKGDNYIPIILTQYSLKVMNQQESFNHINITRDPTYYESSYYWSEWIAPNEIINFNLFAGYYKINLTDNEGGSYSFYSYTLNGDDILLISSDNIISQVIYNIANVNTTIGNQITTVQIDLTNQNSEINNSIITVEINLGNINSTLGNMLINLNVDITNVANNISALYMFTNNSFINLNNNMNNSFIYMENNIVSINQSISNLVIGVSNDIYLINGTISTMISQLETNLLLMNVSIDTALFGLNTTLNLIGSNITANYILLNNSLNIIDTNINDTRIAIINNLLLVNNTISALVADVYSAVYLVNNSIYTAVIDLGTSLSLINNTISGNLSFVLQQNDFLSELYKKTMFSELLNWTNIGLNTSLLTSQIDVWTFVNNYKNQSIEVHLKYQDLIEELVISADDLVSQWLPYEDVEYNLWSVADEEYLDEWEDLTQDNKTVSFGFFETEMPYNPEPIIFDFTIFIAVIIIISCAGWILVFLYFSIKKERDIIPEDTRLRHRKKKKPWKSGTFDHRP